LKKQQDLEDIFSILHDGSIEEWTGDKTKLTLKVSIIYLAELINPSFEFFYVELLNIKKIELEPWMNPPEIEQKIFKTLEDIFKVELEINSAKLQGKEILITCLQHNIKFDYSGGNLIINCEEAKIYDQSMAFLTIEELNEICNKYWEPES
jgi:hypothetical protein